MINLFNSNRFVSQKFLKVEILFFNRKWHEKRRKQSNIKIGEKHKFDHIATFHV